MAGELQGPIIEGTVENVDQGCDLAYRGICTNRDLERRPDMMAYELHGTDETVRCCEPCYDEMCNQA